MPATKIVVNIPGETPYDVRIGGGVLAFTCLGISWNEKTNECSLLILVVAFMAVDA